MNRFPAPRNRRRLLVGCAIVATAAVLTGQQWLTAKGLKPGDPVSKARKLYGKKAARGSSSVLMSSKSGARLTARLGEGVVKSFLVSIPRS